MRAFAFVERKLLTLGCPPSPAVHVTNLNGPNSPFLRYCTIASVREFIEKLEVSDASIVDLIARIILLSLVVSLGTTYRRSRFTSRVEKVAVPYV